ncbi:MAG: MFS transporter [Candidatus Lokiarchaeota archaeon]|nr:MFS transporter [Candidatus Lokiarchaeota archaeon]
MKKRELVSLFFFLSLILIIIMDSALFLPNELLIAADLGIYFDALGIIISIYTITNGISILIFGYLTDMIERKKILILAGVMWSLTAILHIFVEEFWQLLLIRIVAAIAVSVTTPLVISYLADIISSDSRSKSFAFWGLITNIGTLAAGFLALMFNAVDFEAIEIENILEKIDFIALNYPNILYTWRLPYFYFGIIALLFTILNYFVTIEPKRAAKEKQLEEVFLEEDIQYSYKIKFSDLKLVFKRKSNFFLIFNFFDVIASGLVLAYIFPYIQGDLNANISNIKIIILFLFIIVLGLIIGQFWLAHLGDKKVQRGDLSGRVKVAVICSILNLPFFLLGFAMTPNVANSTFFFGTLLVNEIGFWVLWLIYCTLLGVGLAFTMGIGPNYYSSLIDVNFPESRGTMVAVGAFIDSIGRALGAVIGGFMITLTGGDVSATIFWSFLIFGIFSTCLWIPLFFTAKKDYLDINEEMKKRASSLSKMQPEEPR